MLILTSEMFLIKYSVEYCVCFLAVVQVGAEVHGSFVVSKRKNLETLLQYPPT